MPQLHSAHVGWQPLPLNNLTVSIGTIQHGKHVIGIQQSVLVFKCPRDRDISMMLVCVADERTEQVEYLNGHNVFPRQLSEAAKLTGDSCPVLQMLTYEQVSPASPRGSTNLRREFDYDVFNRHALIFATDHGGELRLLATCGRARRLASHGVFRHPRVAPNTLPSGHDLSLQRGERLDIPGTGLITENEVSCSRFTAPGNVFQYLLIRPVRDVVWQIQIPVSSRLHAPQKPLRTEIAGEKWHALKYGIAGPLQGFLPAPAGENVATFQCFGF